MADNVSAVTLPALRVYYAARETLRLLLNEMTARQEVEVSKRMASALGRWVKMTRDQALMAVERDAAARLKIVAPQCMERATAARLMMAATAQVSAATLSSMQVSTHDFFVIREVYLDPAVLATLTHDLQNFVLSPMRN